MDYLNKLEIRKKAQIAAARQAEIELLSSLEEGDEVHFPKELAHQIEPLMALAHEIGKPVRRVERLVIVRDGQAKIPEEVLISKFLADRCEISPEYRCSTRELYASFVEYCQQQRQEAISPLGFGRKIAQRGFQYRERSNPHYFSYRLGLRLRLKKKEDNNPLPSPTSFEVNDSE